MSSAIKNLIKALEEAQGEVPKAAEMKDILRLLGGLSKETKKKLQEEEECDADDCDDDCDDDDESSEEEDESSEEEEDESSEEEEEVEEVIVKRKYKKGPRAKGFRLYIKNGGTRDKWSNKSDKYKDSYYQRHK